RRAHRRNQEAPPRHPRPPRQLGARAVLAPPGALGAPPREDGPRSHRPDLARVHPRLRALPPVPRRAGPERPAQRRALQGLMRRGTSPHAAVARSRATATAAGPRCGRRSSTSAATAVAAAIAAQIEAVATNAWTKASRAATTRVSPSAAGKRAAAA